MTTADTQTPNPADPQKPDRQTFAEFFEEQTGLKFTKQPTPEEMLERAIRRDEYMESIREEVAQFPDNMPEQFVDAYFACHGIDEDGQIIRLAQYSTLVRPDGFQWPLRYFPSTRVGDESTTVEWFVPHDPIPTSAGQVLFGVEAVSSALLNRNGWAACEPPAGGFFECMTHPEHGTQDLEDALALHFSEGGAA